MQVRELHDVGIDQAEHADAGSRQRRRGGGPEPTHPDEEDPGAGEGNIEWSGCLHRQQKSPSPDEKRGLPACEPYLPFTRPGMGRNERRN